MADGNRKLYRKSRECKPRIVLTSLFSLYYVTREGDRYTEDESHAALVVYGYF